MPQCRAWEMVTPPDKVNGAGVSDWSVGDLAAAMVGSPAADGDRFISRASEGHVLTDGDFAFAFDYAFASRSPNGWASRSPFTRPNLSPIGGLVAQLNPVTASDNFELISWETGGDTRLFDAQLSWPLSTRSAYLSDWQGDWETFGPTDPAQGEVNASVRREHAADGEVVLMASRLRGLEGAQDPSLDQMSNSNTVYIDDLSAGLSNSFPGTGVRTLVNACAGEGTARTQLPAVDGSGQLAAQPCPDPPAGRREHLIDPRGAHFEEGPEGTISDDGRRVVFMSPDPTATGSPTSCSGTGSSTRCPTQIYLRINDASGDSVTWVSRSRVTGQDATLSARAYFEGASADGEVVYFRTNAPLTEDDPNGNGSVTPGGVRTGTPDPESWDLFRYEAANGTLERVSAGPTSEADPNASTGSETSYSTEGAVLRALSDDGSRAYFVTRAPIPGAAVSASTTTSPGGTPGSVDAVNLYLYDSTRPLAERWTFVARLPTFAEAGRPGACATASSGKGQNVAQIGSTTPQFDTYGNCVSATSDGAYMVFMTSAPLVGADSSPDVVDIYGYDADQDRMDLITDPQGGSGEEYLCGVTGDVYCRGDTGFGTGNVGGMSDFLVVATDPGTPGDRQVFFQSKSQLLPEDRNHEYDVYSWRNGNLSLLSTGISDGGAYYNGNSEDGKDVFVMTRDRLSWRDVDSVMDVYDARAEGGFARPPVVTECDVLDNRCQDRGDRRPPAPGPVGSAIFRGAANAISRPSRRCRVQGVKAKRSIRRARLVIRRAGRSEGRRAVRLRRQARRAARLAKRERRILQACRRGIGR